MLRTFILCVPFVIASAVARADDAGQGQATPPRAQAAKQESEKSPADVDKPEAKAGTRPEKQPEKQSENEQGKVEGDVKMSGMSILGNEEAPKSLVIVPWKSSQLGETPGISRLLDNSTQPVDKEVFMRELAYYQIKADGK